MKSDSTARALLRAAQPGLLVGVLTLAGLGLGIARYLGYPPAPAPTLLGLGWLASLQVGASLLYAHSGPGTATAPTRDNETPPDLSALKTLRDRRSLILASALIAFTATALCSYGLLLLPGGSTAVPAMMLVGGLLAVGYSLPPARLVVSGFGELSLAVGYGLLTPMFMFLVVAHELDRLVALSTLMLPFMFLALQIAFQFPDYARDVRVGRRRLMVRLGWETCLGLHNGLLLFGFVWLAAALWIGLPRAVGLPTFVAFPLALLQIIYLTRIGQGAQPNWRAVKVNAVAIAMGAVYLLGFGYWIR